MDHQGLDEVIAQLRERGIAAGEAKGRDCIAAAEAKAKACLEAAEAEAKRIVAQAEAAAEALRRQLDAELKQTAAVAIEAFRQAVERDFLCPEVESGVRAALSDPTILGEVLLAAAGAIDAADLEVVLPEALRQQLDGGFVVDLERRAQTPVVVSFDDSLSFGFRVGPSGAGWEYDFSEESYRELFIKYLAPRFRDRFFAR